MERYRDMNLVEYEDRAALMTAVASVLRDDLRAALERGGRATLSVPGGTTPGPVFDQLCRVALDWARVDVVLNDERWVEETSERSNTRLLRERLLVHSASEARLVPLYAPFDTPEEGLRQVRAAVEPVLPISVLLLGMGADMHTASLFPGADHLGAALADEAPSVMALRAEGAGEPRITLTARVLRAADRVHVLIQGPEKRAALERAKSLEIKEAPIRAVLDRATVHWAE